MGKRRLKAATRLPLDFPDHVVLDGKKAKAGNWLVVLEDGSKLVMSDGAFMAEFAEHVPIGPSTSALAIRPSAAAAPRASNAFLDAQPGPGRDGRAPLVKLTDGLEGIVKQVLNPNVFLPGVQVIDTETGEIVYQRAHGIDVDAGRAPRVGKLHVNAQGEVTSMEIEPEEWPPRRKDGETF